MFHGVFILKIKLAIIVTSILLLVLLTSFFIPFYPALVFEHVKSGEILAFQGVEKNQKFDILYTHSVHLTPVLEKYILTDEYKIKQYELVYENYNVGMPSNVSEGEEFVVEDGKIHIKNMNRQFPYINLSVGEVVANHRLLINNQTIPFSNFVTPGTLVKIHYQKLTLYQYLKGDEIID
jgi:hypothetical protein